ncbi:MAG: hypothetical protein ABL994_08165, partial [Verrucomicrobiales bacterium]
LAVSESVDQAVMREEVRAVLLETTRNSALRAGEWDIASKFEEVRYHVTVETASLKDQEAATLSDLYEVVVETFSEGSNEPIDSISTLVYPPMF